MTRPSYWLDAQTHLRADPVLAALIAHVGTDHLVSRGDPFSTLVRAVVGQQISVKAADAVWARLMTAVGNLTPPRLLAHTEADLRAVGLSQSKARYVRGIADGFATGKVHPGLWDDMPEIGRAHV